MIGRARIGPALIGPGARLTGIDTNVLIRALVRDDATQAAAADHLLATLTPEEPGFITLVTMAELDRTLRHSYGLDRQTRLNVIRALIESESLEFEDGESVVRAHALAEEGADFPDALIEASMGQFGVTDVVTFDRAAAKRLGWRLLH